MGRHEASAEEQHTDKSDILAWFGIRIELCASPIDECGCGGA